MVFAVFEEQFVLEPVRLFAVGTNFSGQPKTIGFIDELPKLRSSFGRQFFFVHHGTKPYTCEPATTRKCNAHRIEYYTPTFNPATHYDSGSRKKAQETQKRKQRVSTLQNTDRLPGVFHGFLLFAAVTVEVGGDRYCGVGRIDKFR